MQINEIMTSSPRTIDLNTTIGQAWEELRELDVRHLPVVDGKDLVGIVSDRDFATLPSPPLVRQLIGSPELSLDAPVSTIMTGAPVSVTTDEDVAVAVDLMLDKKVGALPVLSADGVVVGVVSYVDVLRSLRDGLVTLGEDDH
jgi:acetoin utilization protein AcuB